MKIIKSALALVGALTITAAATGISEDRLIEICKDKAESSVSAVANKIIALKENASFDTEKHGYGQGVIVDDKNVPVGASDFNAQYGKYDAYALMENSEKTIYLTFDQGYENGYTEKILDTLKEKNVKATFFLVGDYARRNEELVKRMIDEGHTLGNHSMSHYSMPDLSYDECVEEVSSLHSYVKETYGYDMTLFRPPMGEYSESSLAATQDCGYKTLLWSFAYCDWDVNNQPDPQTAKEKIVSSAHDGAVYLLHSVSSTNAEVLGDVIDELRANGYTFG